MPLERAEYTETKSARELNLNDRIKWGSLWRWIVGLEINNIDGVVSVKLKNWGGVIDFPAEHQLEVKPVQW